MADYRQADLDALCTSGDVIWVGAGSIGQNDGRIRLSVPRDRGAVRRARPTNPSRVTATTRSVAHLGQRGASFWPDLVRACSEAGADYGDSAVLGALWDLVWAGEVTNDSLAPVRSMLSGKGTKAATTAGAKTAPTHGPAESAPPDRQPRQAAGALVAPLLEPRPTPTASAHARAVQLLERYGVLTREAALGEGNEGGFAGVYPVLKALEEQGKVRRGYFVAGLGAAQFALPGAVDRLRRRGEDDDVDGAGRDGPMANRSAPHSPGPTALAAHRAAPAALVVIDNGEALVYVERGGKSLIAFPEAAMPDRGGPRPSPARSTTARAPARDCTKIDGEPAGESGAHGPARRRRLRPRLPAAGATGPDRRTCISRVLKKAGVAPRRSVVRRAACRRLSIQTLENTRSRPTRKAAQGAPLGPKLRF